MPPRTTAEFISLARRMQDRGATTSEWVDLQDEVARASRRGALSVGATEDILESIGDIRRGRGARRNPAELAVPHAARRMYEGFHQYEPKDVGYFPPSFKIPTEAVLVGEAEHVLYRSGKADPATGQLPRGTIDYIHEHDAGVKCYRTDLRGGEPRRVPDFIANAQTLVRLGDSLGFAYDDGETIVDAKTSRPYPELYTIPSGKALLIIQGRRRVVALIWGGRLGVEPRGIVH